MSDESPKPVGFQSEDQSQRWLKYGSNTVVVSVAVVLLAVLVVYIAERKPHRYDTTSTGMYSLKPQTVNLIRENKQPITIISLYTKAKPGEAGTASSDDTSAAAPTDQAGAVADLLEEYRTRGQNISTDTIDPVLNPGKVEDLISQVSEQYDAQIQKYKAFTTALPDRYAAIAKVADPEAAKISALPLRDIQSDELAQTVQLAQISVQDLPTKLKQSEEAYHRFLKQKPPDYKGITDSVSENMQAMSSILARVISDFARLKDDKAVPAPIRQYMTDSAPTYAAMKKQADDLVAEVKGLGELKLDTLREALRQKNPILVRGATQWKVLPYDKVWRTDARDQRGGSGEGATRPRFAGEQMVTSAILALNETAKPKVCFVRGGGEPLTEYGGMMSSVADRLRDYNYDVSEKDLSGTWAMQAMQQQRPTTPEPGDADIDDAVWVVDAMSQPQQNPMMGGPPPSIAPKVAEHIARGHHWADGKKLDGGSAFVMVAPRGDAMTAALSDLGITARPDAVAVHALVKSDAPVDPNDIMNQAQRNPLIFGLNQWGDHPITRSINGLGGVVIQAAIVQTHAVPGVTTTPLLTLPTDPPSWGETDLQSVMTEAGPTQDATDVAGPVSVAAAAERGSGPRVVVMGSEQSFLGATDSLSNNIVDFPDQELLHRRIYAPLFPGNGEFFTNSVYWLSHREAMIAISPTAMNVSRISDMTRATQSFWRVGVLLIGLPGLVLALGAAAYVSRRD